MTKWGDKHMYNWREWMRSLYNLPDKINSWSIDQLSPDRFIVFMLNMLILRGLCYTTIGLMAIPQTIEWAMSNLMSWVNHELSHNNALDGLKGFPVVMVTLFILIPYTVTWGIPKLIQEIKQSRVEKRLQRQVEDMERLREQIAEDRIRWEYRDDTIRRAQEELERLTASRHKKDFKPKKQIKAHSLVKPSVVFRSPGVYIRETDHDFISVDNAFGYIPDTLTVEERGWRVSTTARVRRSRQIRDRGYYNNIGNE